MQRISNIEVSAFAAILVVLLALFLYVPHRYREAPVDLFKAKHPVSLLSASREDAMIVSMQMDGGVFFGSDRSAPELLPHQIRESLAHGAEHRVYLNVDRHAKYQTVKQVIDAIHSTGVERVSFFTGTPAQQK